MVNNEIKMKNINCDTFDKKQIALAIRNSTLGDGLSIQLEVKIQFINKNQNRD